MMGNPKHATTVIRFGGPISWSTGANTPTLGALLGALEVHRSGEITARQKRLRTNTDELLDFVDVAVVAERLCEQMGLSDTEMLAYLQRKGCKIGGATTMIPAISSS